jgi:hypothetical protein
VVGAQAASSEWEAMQQQYLSGDQAVEETTTMQWSKGG